MSPTKDLVSAFFPESENPQPYFKTGAISTAAALLCERIPFLRVERLPNSTECLFVFDAADGEAERVAGEHQRGELRVISSVFTRNNIKIRDALGAFQRKGRL
jgi:hypothetical protein